MVAATSFAACPTAGELALVAQLGSLLQSRAVIERRRWRAYATARLIPVFTLYNLPLDQLRDDLRVDTGIVCPEPLQPTLAALLEHELARAVPRVAVVSRLIEARWRPDWIGSLFAAMSAALYAEAHEAIGNLQGLAPTGHLAERLRSLAVTGALARNSQYGAWGVFHGNVEAPGSEAAFPPSPSLVLALVETAIRQRDRLTAIETVANKLGTLDRRRARAHLARAVLVVEGPRAAELQLRSLRDDSVRDAGWYLLAREAIRSGDESIAHRFAEHVRSPELAERARIAIAWHVFRAGEPLRARRLLGAGADFEHWRLRSMIALRLRPVPQAHVWSRELPRADALPGWLGEPVVEPWLRTRVIAGAAELRNRDVDHGARLAAMELGVTARDPAARREVIEMLDDLGSEPFQVLGRMRANAAPDRVQPHDILLAEWIATRAETITRERAALSRWTQAGIDGERPPTTAAALRHREQLRNARDNDDAATVAELLGETREAECPPAAERRLALDEQRSLDRALYDEGSTWNAPRRIGMIAAARACLRGALEDPTWEPALVECRIRTLGRLGGLLAREVLEHAIANASDSRYLPHLIEALCRIDCDAAARLAIARATALRDTVDPQLRDVLAIVELYRGLPRGFTRSWCETERLAAKRLDLRRARRFLAGVVALRGIPDPTLLDWIASRVAAAPLLDAEVVLSLAQQSCDALGTIWPTEAAQRLADDPGLRQTLLLLRGVRVVTRARQWSDLQWRTVLAAAASPSRGVVDRPVVRRCARHLGCDPIRLAAGDLAGIGVQRERVILEGYRVRLLEKRRDILQYLRFADVPAVNCYRSDSRLYASGQNDVITVWKDPLSFCFWIERADGRPFGFVFGNFVELASNELAVALNGLYLGRQRLELRTAVLRAIEQMLCAPLGIRHIGVGRQFAGRGPFPIDYQYRRVSATRLRALRVNGALVTRVWDDISWEINVPTILELWWKRR